MQWQHKLSCTEALRGSAKYREAFDTLARKTGIGAPIGGSGTEGADISRWPSAQREEFADAIWRASEMPPEAEFLEQYKPYCTWAELGDAIALGHEVGLHTASHPFCDALSEADIAVEFVAPAALLRERLGIQSLAFAYPFGRRLPGQLETMAQKAADLACLLGSSGVSPRSVPPEAWRRVNLEKGIDRWLFGQPIVNAIF